jgi:hypothetical protein
MLIRRNGMTQNRTLYEGLFFFHSCNKPFLQPVLLSMSFYGVASMMRAIETCMSSAYDMTS